MPFPLTHMCVAWRILEKNPLPQKEAAQFMLGAISPDAIHYRAEYQGAEMKNIGPAKKTTHLCPVSEEKWGQVTDNVGWEKIIRDFSRAHRGDPFAQGYASHTLTDLHNNSTLWKTFITNHPTEAAKGYASDYYKDLKAIDTRLYFEYPATAQIMQLLSYATPEEIPTLVTKQETHAIQQNILHTHFANATPAKNHTYLFTTYENTLDFIESATKLCFTLI